MTCGKILAPLVSAATQNSKNTAVYPHDCSGIVRLFNWSVNFSTKAFAASAFIVLSKTQIKNTKTVKQPEVEAALTETLLGVMPQRYRNYHGAGKTTLLRGEMYSCVRPTLRSEGECNS